MLQLTGQRLKKAAGISEVDFICHKDTWEWITAQRRWLPEANDAEGPMVHLRLSGPDLARVLQVCWFLKTLFLGVSRALARRIYDAIAEVIDQVDPAAKDGTPVPPIVIDDKIQEA